MGSVIGYGALGVGVIMTLIAAVRYHLSSNQIDVIDQIYGETYERQGQEISRYLKRELKDNEILVLDDLENKTITIYQNFNRGEEVVHPHSTVTLPYEDNGRSKFVEWADGRDLSQLHFVTPKELRERT